MDYLETYAQLTTGQLLRLVREQGALTDEARRALEVELQRRGLSVQQELEGEQALLQEQQAELESERQEKAEVAEERFWDKVEFWTQLLIWAFAAAVSAILAPLCVGEFNANAIWSLTSDLLLLALIGAFISSLLPERWTRLTTSFLMAAVTMLVASVAWVLRR